MVISFDFISGDDFRASLESDYQELNASMHSGSWKAVHVLAGSIIEAVLTDYLIATDYQKRNNTDPLKMDLDKVIAACETEGVLTQRTAQLSHVIRSYRNLIHPGRLIRLGETVDEGGAKIAQALVELVVTDVAARKKTTYGYTAEQIVSKLENDSSAIAFLGHLLRQVNEFERKRLLLNVLPQRYLELILQDTSEDMLIPLRDCFRLVYRTSSEEVKKNVAKQFVSILKEESQQKVRAYERAFFRASDLKNYSGPDAQLVKTHILSLLEGYVDLRVLEMMEGVGHFVTSFEIWTFISRLLQAMKSAIAFEQKDMIEAITLRIIRERWNMDEQNRTKALEVLNNSIAIYEEEKDLRMVQIIKSIIASREEDDELPF
jgi:hypothetical protein